MEGNTFLVISDGGGPHDLVAVYSGDKQFVGDTARVSTSVNRAATDVAVTSNRKPATETGSVTFTASVATVGQGALPTNATSFYADGALLGDAKMVSGKASFSISTLALGFHQVTATYQGDQNHLAAASPALTEASAPNRS